MPPSYAISPTLLLDHRCLCQLFCVLFERTIKGHPGALPVSLGRTDVTQHLPKGYVVSPKADGQRVFLIFDQDIMIVYGRDESVGLVACTLPALSRTDTQSFFERTDPVVTSVDTSSFNGFVFDAEFIESSKTLWVFDTLLFNGRSSVGQCYLTRIELANLFVYHYGDKTGAMRSATEVPSQYPPSRFCIDDGRWTMHVKPVHLAHHAQKVWADSSEQPVPCDGLIFTRLRARYEPFRSAPTSVFKWKPTHTLDFRLVVRTTASRPVAVAGVLRLYQTRNGSSALLASGSDGVEQVVAFLDSAVAADGRVWECEWRDGAWHVLKPRVDKSTPNTLDTVASTVQHIHEAVTIHEL